MSQIEAQLKYEAITNIDYNADFTFIQYKNISNTTDFES